MANKFKDIYSLLPWDKKDQFLQWATSRYGRRATSIETHWIGRGCVPKRWDEEVYSELQKIAEQ